MKNILLPLAALGLLLPLHAEDYKIPKKDPVFTLSFPDKWTVTHADESVDGVTEDKSIELYAQTDDADSIEDSVKAAIDYLTKAGVKIKADSQKEHNSEVNGMKLSGLNWDATDEDGACRVSLSFIDIGDDQAITLLYWGSEEASKKHSKELDSIIGSMKVVKAKAEKKDDKEEEKEDGDEKEEK